MPMVNPVSTRGVRSCCGSRTSQIYQPIKFAQKYLAASVKIERGQCGLPIRKSDEGVFNSDMDVRVAARDQRREQGEAAIVACKDVSKRADHLPTFDEMSRMMHLAYAGDKRIHESPLRAMQTGVEVRISHATGVRGEKIRSAHFEHIWPRPYPHLANFEGIDGTVFYNTRKGKTNETGEASHAGWLPSKNPLFDIDGGEGLCLLYRFTNGESFPHVTEDNGGKSPGYQYKWLPLLKNTEGSYALDSTKALLPVRAYGPKPQNACWNMLYNAAGIEMYENDSLTHGGRAACNQEWREAGGDPRVSDEALGCTHDVSKDFYAPQIPLPFALQRNQFGYLAGENLSEADAAQLRAGRRKAKEPLRKLLDIVLPELAREEDIVAAIDTTAGDDCNRKSVMEQKRINTASHKREHQQFLGKVRQMTSMAILDAAARPHKFDGSIDFNAKSLIDAHGHEPVYKAIRIRSDDTWLFDHPLFKEVQAAVIEEEEKERSLVIVSDSRSKTATAAATMVVAAQSAQLNRIEQSLLVHATSITTAAEAAATMEGNLGKKMDDLPDAISARVEAPLNAAACDKEAAECRELGQQYRTVMRAFYVSGPDHDELTALGSDFEHVKLTRCSHNDDDLAVLEQFYMYSAEADEEYEMTSAWIQRFRDLLAKGYDHGLLPGRHNINPPLPIAPISPALTVVSPSATTTTIPRSADTFAAVPNKGQQLCAKIDGLIQAFESTLALSSSQPHDDELHRILQEGLSLVRPGAQIVRRRRGSVPSHPAQGTVVLADTPTIGKRKRSADCTGLPHQSLTECGDIDGLWNEYVGADGQGGLRRRESLDRKWAGEGPANKPNRDLFTEKMFVYREIAKQACDRGNIPDALKAVQERLDGFKKQGRGGWGGKKVGLLGALRSEQPEGKVRDGLTRLLSEMDTSR